MAKKLKLTFKTEGNGTMELSIADPKDNLTLADAQTAAGSLIPILMTNGGAMATELKEAVIVNTDEMPLK